MQPGEEDFGIVAVEALASGKSVIALARGGILEIVPPGTDGGVLYQNTGAENLEVAVSAFEKNCSEAFVNKLQMAARRFSEDRFAESLLQVIGQTSEPLACRTGGNHSQPLLAESVSAASR